MNLKNQPPLFVPFEFRAEIEKLSKAALMDMVWDYAFQISGEAPDAAMEEFRNRREIIEAHRRNARKAA
jgi:hypothetical protein